MSTSSYLDKFQRSLPSVQGKQILRLLIEKKNSGEIKTLDEFKDNLKQLTTELLAQQLKPTLKLWFAIAGQDISSEQYNDMLQKIGNDLEAGFAEANNVEELIEAHHQLINNVSLKMIRYGLNKLEEQVSLYEFLQSDTHGFDSSLYDTFRSSENMSASRSDASATQLYTDPHEGDTLSVDYDCVVDAIGERLMMGYEEQSYIVPKAAKHLTGASSIRSELDVSFANSNINNIIDGKTNTYWATSILLAATRSTGAPVEIQIDLPASQDVNFVEIEPVSYYPMRLSAVKYYDANQILQTASLPDKLLYGPARINFNRITTGSLILTFSQENCDEVQFRKRPAEVNFYKAILSGNASKPNMADVKSTLEAVTTSSFLLNEVFNPGPTYDEQAKYFEYVVGFDNIRVGFSKFLDRSIYVSKKKTVFDPGVISLRTEEWRPLQSSSSNTITLTEHQYPARSTLWDNTFHHGIVEYWLLIQSFTAGGTLIATDYVPVLPLGATRIYHERMIFTQRSTSSYLNYNSGSLIHYTANNEGDVFLYKNGVLLSYGEDWSFDTSSGVNQTNPDGTTRMKRGLKLLSEPGTLDIYTVSYTPTLSNTMVIPNNTDLLGVVSLTDGSHIRVGKDNIVLFEQVRDAFVVHHADVSLIVLMRRNSANMNVGPVLEEYMVVTGSRLVNKYAKDF
jgi:hypothetical protein